MFKCTLKIYVHFKNKRFEDITEQLSRKNEYERNIKKSNLILYEITTQKDLEDFSNNFDVVMNRQIYKIIFTNDYKFIPNEVAEKVNDIRILPKSEDEYKVILRYVKTIVAKKYDGILLAHAFDACIDLSPNLIWFKDNNGTHVNINSRFSKLVNKAKEEIIGEDYYSIWGVEEPEEIKQLRKKFPETVVEQLKVDGQVHHIRTTKGPVYGFDEKVIGMCGIGVDMTEGERYLYEIERMASLDFLTNLFNRRFLYDYLSKNKEEPYTIIYLDLNCFKMINDSYGHEEGDCALILTADILKENFPKDINCRIGGDEFVSVVFGKKNEREVENMVNELQKSLNASYIKKKTLYGLSASIGYVYVENPRAYSVDEIISDADRMMYKKKQIYHKFVTKTHTQNK